MHIQRHDTKKQRWECIEENKKVRKQENKNSTKKAIKNARKQELDQEKKKEKKILDHFLGRVLVFFYKFPPQNRKEKRDTKWMRWTSRMSRERWID